MVDAKTPAADTQFPPSLIASLKNGSLVFDDISSLSRGRATVIVACLATGNRDQRANFIQLMAQLEFTDILIDSLNDMCTEDRILLLRAVGEEKEEDIRLARTVLWASLDGIVDSRLYITLKAVLLGQDSGAIREINAYLSSGIDKSWIFLRALAFDESVDDKNFSQLFLSLSFRNRTLAMESLFSCSDDEVRDFFKRLCDAIYDSNQGVLCSKIEKVIDAISEVNRNALLTQIVMDPDGNRTVDRQANKAQRFFADYCERKGASALTAWISSLPAETKTVWIRFLFFNVRNNDIMTALLDGLKEEAQTGFSATYTVTESLEPKSMTYAKIAAKIGGGLLASMVFTPASLVPLGVSTVADIIKLRNPTPSVTHIDICTEINMMTSKFLADPPWRDSDKSLARKKISELMQHGYMRALLYLKPSEIKSLIKVFLYDPADMAGLKFILATLPPQLSAKLARSISAAVIELVAETKAGSSIGDILKGLTITGKIGSSFSKKSGEAKGQSIEELGSISAEIGFSWSPSALVDGKRSRELNSLMAELSGFMSDWMVHLNNMTPNQKFIFLEEMKDYVKIEFKV